jgi:hypothetical protein
MENLFTTSFGRNGPSSSKTHIKKYEEQLLPSKLSEFKCDLILHVIVLYWREIRVYIDVGYNVDMQKAERKNFLWVICWFFYHCKTR